MPTDDILDEIEEFHANLAAALDWSADDPPLGLRLLRGVAIAWEDLGRAGDAMAAADRLLTDDNAQRVQRRVARRRLEDVRPLLLGARASGDDARSSSASKQSRHDAATTLPATGTLAEGVVCHRCRVARPGPRERLTATCEAWAPIWLAWVLAEDDPAAAAPVARRGRCCRGGERHALLARFRALRASRTGHVRPAISPPPSSSRRTSCRVRGQRGGVTPSAVSSFAALLAEDEDALRCAATPPSEPCVPHPACHRGPSTARHRLGLLARSPERRECRIRDPPGPMCSTLWLRAASRSTPGPQMSPSITPASGRDPNLTLGPSSPRSRVPPPATRTAGTTPSPSPSTTASGSSPSTPSKAWPSPPPGPRAGPSAYGSSPPRERLRDETGYRWRFAFEQRAVDTARTAAVERARRRRRGCRRRGAQARLARSRRLRPPRSRRAETAPPRLGQPHPDRTTRSWHSSPRG